MEIIKNSLSVAKNIVYTNCRLKHYNNELSMCQVAEFPLFKATSFECQNAKEKILLPPSEKNPLYVQYCSIIRAKARLRDIALCNDFDYFVTLTFNKEYVNRYSPNDIYKKLSVWLRNASARHCIKYVLIPEYHKDGAIHLHGLFCCGDYKLHNSKKKTDKGQKIYNLKEFQFGFNTFIEIDKKTDGSYTKVCNYILKYITKDTAKIFGKYYLSSRSLIKKPDIEICSPVDYFSMVTNLEGQGKQYKLPQGGSLFQFTL